MIVDEGHHLIAVNYAGSLVDFFLPTPTRPTPTRPTPHPTTHTAPQTGWGKTMSMTKANTAQYDIPLRITYALKGLSPVFRIDIKL